MKKKPVKKESSVSTFSDLAAARRMDATYLGCRVDAELKGWFLGYCLSHKLNPSRALREILIRYRELVEKKSASA